MSKNPFEPNKRGLVVVVLKKNYASNVAGEKAGFLPEIAKDLVRKGYAALIGAKNDAEKPAEGGDGAEITSRKFNPAKQDSDPVLTGSATDSLRAEFKELTGSDPDARWGAARLAAEIDKAKELAGEPEGDAEKPAEGGDGA